MYFLQGRPLPVISRVIPPLIGAVPQFPIYMAFIGFTWVPFHPLKNHRRSTKTTAGDFVATLREAVDCEVCPSGSFSEVPHVLPCPVGWFGWSKC